jgi:hypothetical protein
LNCRRNRVHCHAMPGTAKQSSVVPARSLDQRLEALARANEVRSRRAALKDALKRGEQDLRDVLAAPPEYLRTAKVLDLLMATPKLGRVKSARVLEQCRISPSKTVGGLSERQRAKLLAYLGG